MRPSVKTFRFIIGIGSLAFISRNIDFPGHAGINAYRTEKVFIVYLLSVHVIINELEGDVENPFVGVVS